jgi:hypothetical protein
MSVCADWVKESSVSDPDAGHTGLEQVETYVWVRGLENNAVIGDPK